MPLATIALRDTLLNKLLGIQPQFFLNDPPRQADSPVNRSIAEELKSAMNMFKASAISGEGTHVDYARLAGSPAYLEYRQKCSPHLYRFNPDSLESTAEKLAFWINLYNALIIDAVIHFKVQNSVTEGPVGILRFFRRAAYNVGGQRLSCEDIEHGILRANRGNPYIPGAHFGKDDPRARWVLPKLDPRIHFALNCASKSCPPIGVYTPESIATQLDTAARNFIAHETKIDQTAGIIHLSQLFNWYQTDFGGRAGLIGFIASHHPQKEWLLSNQKQLKIKYTPYDWALNL